jgi:hypothetical protein
MNECAVWRLVLGTVASSSTPSERDCSRLSGLFRSLSLSSFHHSVIVVSGVSGEKHDVSFSHHSLGFFVFAGDEDEGL